MGHFQLSLFYGLLLVLLVSPWIGAEVCVEEEQCWAALELTERVVWEQAGAVLSQSPAAHEELLLRVVELPILNKSFAIAMCTEGERPVDRYCCWLHILAHTLGRGLVPAGV